MAAPLRAEFSAEVLNCFRRLHRTRQKVFNNDPRALEAARLKINSEFRKHRAVSRTDTITELVKFGNQAEEILRTSVVQATPVDDNTFALRFSKDTAMFDNTPYRG